MTDVTITIKSYKNLRVVKYTPEIDWRENCYLLAFPNKDCLIVDPGFSCEEIPTYIETQGYRAKNILLTHAHHDHLACAEHIGRYFDIPCLVDTADKRLLMHAPMYGMLFAGKNVERPRNVLWLNEEIEQELMAHYNVRIMRTPGHTPGGVCLACNEAFFSGDTVVRGYMGRTDLPGGNREKLQDSIAYLLGNDNLSDILDVYPGHGQVWTMEELRKWWRDGNCPEQKSFE